MIRLFIKDLKPGDILLKHNFAVKDIVKKVSKNNANYYTLTLSDKTGQVDGKIWADYFNDTDVSNLKAGVVIEVIGKVDSFRDENQVIIEKAKILSDYEPSDYINEGTKDRVKLFDDILTLVNSLDDADIKDFCNRVFADKDLVKKYTTVPAGVIVHHNYVGGLLEHVTEMLGFAKMAKEVYPDIKYSELVFGILFHDLGKIQELSAGGVTLSMTVSGKLIGHLSQGLLILEGFFGNDFDADKKMRLQHMILSHHGEREKGSPVHPATIEAVILSEIDDLSSRVGILRAHLQRGDVDESGFTSQSYFLGSAILDPTTY